MVDYFADFNFMLQNIVTWMMTLVLVFLAFATIVGFLMFIANRRFNKYMFIGFVLFLVCMLIFTKVFGYRMEFYDASMNQIMIYTLWYLMFFFKGAPTQPPPDSESSIFTLLTLFSLLI